jgi:hypothetical protein
MRIWMLASLLFAVTAIGGDRGIETSSRFSDAFVLLMECVPYAEASTPSSTIQ